MTKAYLSKKIKSPYADHDKWVLFVHISNNAWEV
jgi:hypothetical protein